MDFADSPRIVKLAACSFADDVKDVPGQTISRDEETDYEMTTRISPVGPSLSWTSAMS